MGGKTAAFNQRITPQLRARLDRIYNVHGVTDAEIAEDALGAFADYVEAAGGYKRPIKVIFDEDAAEHANSLAAEGPAPEEIRKHAANLLSNSARAGAKTAGSATPQPTPTPHARKRAARE